MNHQILTDQTVVYYEVRVNGVAVSPKLESQMIAVAEKAKLPAETQAIAEVVPVTADGKELLLG